MEFNNYEIGNTIRSFRERMNMTSAELSMAADLSMCHLYKIEEGTHGISLKTLGRLMTALNVDANTILGVPAPKDIEVNPWNEKMNMLPESSRRYLETIFNQMVDQEVLRTKEN